MATTAAAPLITFAEFMHQKPHFLSAPAKAEVASLESLIQQGTTSFSGDKQPSRRRCRFVPYPSDAAAEEPKQQHNPLPTPPPPTIAAPPPTAPATFFRFKPWMLEAVVVRPPPPPAVVQPQQHAKKTAAVRPRKVIGKALRHAIDTMQYPSFDLAFDRCLEDARKTSVWANVLATVSFAVGAMPCDSVEIVTAATYLQGCINKLGVDDMTLLTAAVEGHVARFRPFGNLLAMMKQLAEPVRPTPPPLVFEEPISSCPVEAVSEAHEHLLSLDIPWEDLCAALLVQQQQQ